MTADDRPVSDYDQVTRNPAEIKRWVRQRGGDPAAITDDAKEDANPGRPTVRFPGNDEDGVVRIGWDEFFERLAAAELAFAYVAESSEAACAVIDGDRAEAVAEGEVIGERPEDAYERLGRNSDGADSSARHREAVDGANADGHRDEPPFNS